MKTKDYLRRYGQAKRRISQIDSRIRVLRDDIDSTPIDYSGMPRGSGTSSRVESWIVRYDDQLERLLKEKEELINEKLEIAEFIASIQDDTLSRVLELRYIECLDWVTIAERMHYSERYVKSDLHGAAISLATKMLRSR